MEKIGFRDLNIWLKIPIVVVYIGIIFNVISWLLLTVLLFLGLLE